MGISKEVSGLVLLVGLILLFLVSLFISGCVEKEKTPPVCYAKCLSDADHIEGCIEGWYENCTGKK